MKYVLTYASLNLFYGSTSKVASKCFESVAEIEDEGVLSFPALLLFAAICLPPSPHEAFRSLKVILSPKKSTASAGWGHFGTNPKILGSLEGPEGYLCPGIHILDIISIYG